MFSLSGLCVWGGCLRIAFKPWRAVIWMGDRSIWVIMGDRTIPNLWACREADFSLMKRKRIHKKQTGLPWEQRQGFPLRRGSGRGQARFLRGLWLDDTENFSAQSVPPPGAHTLMSSPCLSTGQPKACFWQSWRGQRGCTSLLRSFAWGRNHPPSPWLALMKPVAACGGPHSKGLGAASHWQRPKISGPSVWQPTRNWILPTTTSSEVDCSPGSLRWDPSPGPHPNHSLMRPWAEDATEPRFLTLRNWDNRYVLFELLSLW